MSLAVSVFMNVFWFGLGLFLAILALAVVAGIIMGTLKFLERYLESKL